MLNLTYATTNSSAPEINVKVSKLTYELELYYQKMYSKKHGMEQIFSTMIMVSYTLEGGNFKQNIFTIYHISMPSNDWDSKAAYLKLLFDSKDHTFIQTTKLQTGEKVNFEFGTYKITKNNYKDPKNIKWQSK
ncbi:hypothetical protein [Francisella sp. SYW-9]|uniref:hypothetical protein n=1 Tax=Francisella sp. SYW-9 TaxID=2610888 RepID=UPI00123DB366|nr:hypothetical protein [Francisella sp. SYW-9]